MHQPSQRPRTVDFEAALVVEAPCLFLDLRGELDLYSAREMPQDAYSSRSDLTTVLIDLSGLTFCDVAGLSALLTFRKLHETQGRSVTLFGANPCIRRLMFLCGVQHRSEFASPVKRTLV